MLRAAGGGRFSLKLCGAFAAGTATAAAAASALAAPRSPSAARGRPQCCKWRSHDVTRRSRAAPRPPALRGALPLRASRPRGHVGAAAAILGSGEEGRRARGAGRGRRAGCWAACRSCGRRRRRCCGWRRHCTSSSPGSRSVAPGGRCAPGAGRAVPLPRGAALRPADVCASAAAWRENAGRRKRFVSAWPPRGDRESLASLRAQVEELALQSMIRSREEDLAAAPGAEDPQQVRHSANGSGPSASPSLRVWEWLLASDAPKCKAGTVLAERRLECGYGLSLQLSSWDCSVMLIASLGCWGRQLQCRLNGALTAPRSAVRSALLLALTALSCTLLSWQILGQMDDEAAINQTELQLSIRDYEEEMEEEEESDSWGRKESKWFLIQTQEFLLCSCRQMFVLCCVTCQTPRVAGYLWGHKCPRLGRSWIRC